MLQSDVISVYNFQYVLQLNEALAAARADVSRLHTERERYEETIKKAFMRGVCALNMEAMSMFHEAAQQGNGTWFERPPFYKDFNP